MEGIRVKKNKNTKWKWKGIAMEKEGMAKGKKNMHSSLHYLILN